MTDTDILALLAAHGIKPTANRITIVRAMAGQGLTSMMGLEASLGTIDKSVISRTLAVFRQHGLVHEIADGTDTAKYELCLSPAGHADGDDEDSHIHFYCERCRTTYCLPAIHTPVVPLPEGYVMHQASYVVHGLCPRCASHQN